MPVKLSDLVRNYPHLRPILNILRPHLLRDPSNITVYSFLEAEKQGFKIPETVLAFAIPPGRLFFRRIPPDEYTFAHELIHLCRKPEGIDEEVYAYNLADAIVYMAQQGIAIDPFKMFQLTKSDVENALKKLGINSIEEYYQLAGIQPIIHEVGTVGNKEDVMQGRGYSEKEMVMLFITDIIDGLRHSILARKIFHELIRILEKKDVVTPGGHNKKAGQEERVKLHN